MAKKNYGVSLLKGIMSFEVVCCHFLVTANAPRWQLPFSMLKSSAVPVFMLLSFLLCRDSIMSGSLETLKKRCRRLYWPQFAWGVVYWVICSALGLLDGSGPVSLSQLLWQLTTGNSERLNPAMWYQADLLVLTVLFSLPFLWRRPGFGKTLFALLAAAALILQYTKVNYVLLEPLRYELVYPLGRIAELLPYGAAAVCVFDARLLERIKAHWVAGCGAGLLICAIALLLKKPLTLYDSFGYGGFHLLLCAVGMVIFFYALPLERLNARILAIIDGISGYCLGIYCIHLLIAKLLYPIFLELDLPVEGLGHCVLLYVLSWLVCWLLARTGKKPLAAMVR